MPEPAPSNKRPLWRNPWLWGVAAFIALDALFRFTPLLKRIPDPPTVIATLPDFALILSDGGPFTQADLSGTVHLAGFVAGRADSDALLDSMLLLEAYMLEQTPYERYGEHLRLMLITVGAAPPEALSDLARDKGLDRTRWTLLTGDTEGLIRVFAAAVEEPDSLVGSSLVAMVDGEGGIRGFFDAATEDGRDEAFWRGMRTLEEAHAGRLSPP